MKIGAEDKASGTPSWALLPNPKLRIPESIPPLSVNLHELVLK
jgi:hypothetical protein